MGVASYNVKVERSDVLSKALVYYPSQNTEWTNIAPIAGTPNPPGGIPSAVPPTGTSQQLVPGVVPPTIDGVYEAAAQSMYSPNALRFQPYGGGPGANFSMRVWGWCFYPKNGQALWKTVWVPKLLAEFTCTCSTTLAGPFTPGSGGGMIGDDYLCDTIVLAQGLVGVDGWVNSFGPGSELAAEAKVCLNGAKYIQFDFKQIDPVRMNCFWAFSS